MQVILLKMDGLDWPVSDISILDRRWQNSIVQLPCRFSTCPFQFLNRSTRVKAEGEVENGKDLEPSKSRDWRKVRLANDTKTIRFRAIEIIANRISDAPILR